MRSPSAESRSIARAAGVVGGLTLMSRVAGLVRDAVVGYYFGTGAAADAFFVAFRVPNLLRRFVAEGAMSVAFIPVFSEYLATRSRRTVAEAASALATTMVAGLAVLTTAGVWLAPWWTALFAPGFLDDPEKFALTVKLTRLIFPYVFFVSVTALLSGLLNSLRHFAAPAFAPVVLNLAIIAAAVVLTPFLAVPVTALAYGVILGGMLQLALQLPPLWRRGMRLVPRWQPGHEVVRRSLGLMAPMVFGAAVYQINIMVSTVLASLLPSGSVSYLWYADRVFEFPLGIFAAALGTAALPSFSTQAARGAHDELRQSLAFSIRTCNAIVIPAAVGIIVLATPITAVLFQRGAFGAEPVRLTAQALAAFALGLWSVSMVRLVVPAFYAMHDTRTPVITAGVAFLANIVASILLMGPVVGAGKSSIGDTIAALTRLIAVVGLRHTGLALATSISASVNLICLATVLQRRLGSLRGMGIAPSFLRSLVASLAMIPAVNVIVHRVNWSETHGVAHASALLAAIVAGVVVYGLTITLAGGEEAHVLVSVLRQRLPWSTTAIPRRQEESIPNDSGDETSAVRPRTQDGH